MKNVILGAIGMLFVLFLIGYCNNQASDNSQGSDSTNETAETSAKWYYDTKQDEMTDKIVKRAFLYSLDKEPDNEYGTIGEDAGLAIILIKHDGQESVFLHLYWAAVFSDAVTVRFDKTAPISYSIKSMDDDNGNGDGKTAVILNSLEFIEKLRTAKSCVISVPGIGHAPYLYHFTIPLLKW